MQPLVQRFVTPLRDDREAPIAVTPSGMRRLFAPLAVAAAMAVPSTASAAVAHTVQPGETLWSIAAANNLYTSALAAYNGLNEDSQVILGSTVMVPSADEALVSVNNAIAAGTLSPYAATDDSDSSTP